VMSGWARPWKQRAAESPHCSLAVHPYTQVLRRSREHSPRRQGSSTVVAHTGRSAHFEKPRIVDG
jgi:hypothetical protein